MDEPRIVAESTANCTCWRITISFCCRATSGFFGFFFTEISTALSFCGLISSFSDATRYPSASTVIAASPGETRSKRNWPDGSLEPESSFFCASTILIAAPPTKLPLSRSFTLPRMLPTRGSATSGQSSWTSPPASSVEHVPGL